MIRTASRRNRPENVAVWTVVVSETAWNPDKNEGMHQMCCMFYPRESHMTDASQYVAMFKDARDAASAMGEGVDGVIGLAGSARAVWNDPGFATVSAFCERAGSAVEKGKGAVAAAEQLPALARRMAGIFDVGGATVQVPALPSRIASSATSVASNAASQVASAGSALGGLVPGLSLGVGLLNLGVGVYNAVQIRRLGVQVEALHDDVSRGFARVDESLAWQSHQIARLVAGQASMHARLEQLRQEINAGFDRVESAVQGAEERHIADEYHEKVAVLTNRYRKVNETLADGATPRGSDLHRLLDAGEQLDAWAGAQLKRHKVGAPARLPYLVVQALSTRVCADARAVEVGRPEVDRDVSRMVATISQEVFALCNGHDLYWIGVEVPEVITQYVYLARGLVMGQLFASRAEGEELALLDAPWDDGLAPLRAVAGLSLTDEPGWIPLGTLHDLAWFTTWSDADADATDLRGVRAVDLLAVAKSVGLPGRPAKPTRAQVEMLLAIALPTFREQALARLMLAFNWERAPKFVTREAKPAETTTRLSAPPVETSPAPPTPPPVLPPPEPPPGFAPLSHLSLPPSFPSPPGCSPPPVASRWGTATTPKGVFALTGGRQVSLAVGDEGSSEVTLTCMGERVIVGADEGIPMEGVRVVPFRVLTSGDTVHVAHGDGERFDPLQVHLDGVEKPTIDERLKFIGALARVKGFTDSLSGAAAVASAEVAFRAGHLKEVFPKEVKCLLRWAYHLDGPANCGLALGEAAGCIWSPGSVFGTDVKTFRYGDSSAYGTSVWWSSRTIRVDTVGFLVAPDSSSGLTFLSTLAAIFASLDLPYREKP